MSSKISKRADALDLATDVLLLVAAENRSKGTAFGVVTAARIENAVGILRRVVAEALAQE